MLRWVYLIARNEWDDALRSRRALLVILLYLFAAVLTMSGLLSVLLRLERELADVLLLSASAEPGAVVDALWKSARFRGMVSSSIGSSSIANDLIGISPIVLAFAGLAFFYTPFLVALLSPMRISEEMATGSVRYVALRAPRVAWSLGKFTGQALLVGAALLISMAGAWLIVLYRMPAADFGGTLRGMLLWTGRVWMYALAYIGLTMGVAHGTRSIARSMAFALLAVFGMSLLAWACTHFADTWMKGIGPILYQVTPQAYRGDLWRREAVQWASASIVLCALSLSYLLAGAAWLRRRDL